MVLLWAVTAVFSLFFWRLWAVLPYRWRRVVTECRARSQAKNGSGKANVMESTKPSRSGPPGKVNTLVVLGSGEYVSISKNFSFALGYYLAATYFRVRSYTRRREGGRKRALLLRVIPTAVLNGHLSVFIKLHITVLLY